MATTILVSFDVRVGGTGYIEKHGRLKYECPVSCGTGQNVLYMLLYTRALSKVQFLAFSCVFVCIVFLYVSCVLRFELAKKP